jgi:hypothetical protein
LQCYKLPLSQLQLRHAVDVAMLQAATATVATALGVCEVAIYRDPTLVDDERAMHQVLATLYPGAAPPVVASVLCPKCVQRFQSSGIGLHR